MTLTQDCRNVFFNKCHSTLLTERLNCFFMIKIDQVKKGEKSPLLFYKNCASEKAIEK